MRLGETVGQQFMPASQTFRSAKHKIRVKNPSDTGFVLFLLRGANICYSF